MASQHIQACLVGPSPVPLHILLALEYLPIDTGRRTEEDLRGRGDVLQGVQRPNSFIFRAGLLR